MFHGRDQQRVEAHALAAKVHFRRERQHIGFGRATGERYATRIRANERGNLRSRRLNDRPRGPSFGITVEALAGRSNDPRMAARAAARSGDVAL
jgi:hypothetical protein